VAGLVLQDHLEDRSGAPLRDGHPIDARQEERQLLPRRDALQGRDSRGVHHPLGGIAKQVLHGREAESLESGVFGARHEIEGGGSQVGETRRRRGRGRGGDRGRARFPEGPELQPREGLLEQGHPLVLGEGEVTGEAIPKVVEENPVFGVGGTSGRDLAQGLIDPPEEETVQTPFDRAVVATLAQFGP